MTRMVGGDVPVLANWILAQATPGVPAEQEVVPEVGPNFFTELGQNLRDFLPNLLAAIAILVIGWLLAAIASAIVRGILNRTNLDNRIAASVSSQHDRTTAPQVEKWISGAVFWIIIIFTVVAVLQQLDLGAVSEPLNNFLGQVIGYLPKLFGALILLGLAWLIATIVKLLVTKALDAFGLDERLGEQVNEPPQSDTTFGQSTDAFGQPVDATPPGTTTQQVRPSGSGANPFSLSQAIGNALYWFIFLLFLPLILNVLDLESALAPVQSLLNSILLIIPNILAAIVIVGAGWLLAQVVRRIITNVLAATGTDQIGARFGLSRTRGGQSLSWIIGTIVYVLLLIPTAIAALETLQIEAISRPAIAMLNEILGAVPDIFTAGLILVLAYAIGHFVSDLVTNILTSIGFNNVFYWLGLQQTPDAPPPPGPPPAPQPEMAQMPGQPGLPAPPARKTPSEIVGLIALVGIMLFAILAAVNILNIPALTALVGGIVIILGRILAGLIVFAIGLYLANLAFSIITSSGGAQARILGQAARIAIIALVSAMALQQMGIASSIVNLAFGLLLGAIAVAIALAFGLGGRDIAAEQVRSWLSSFREKRD